MNESNASNLSSKGESTRSKSLTPAILGVTKPHGIKLSLMTSEDKKELLHNLEEWRKARKEKLAARILAKQRVVEKSKPPLNFAMPKAKSVTPSSGGIPKSQDKETVFERLYKSNGKFKKPEVSAISNKVSETQNNTQKSVPATSNKPLKVSENDTFQNEISKASGNEFVPEESLNNMINLPKGSEVSTEGRAQKTFEQPSKALDSTVKKVSEFSEPKSSELKSLKNKSPVTKKMEINKFSLFTEASCKNLPPKTPLRRSISMLFRQKSKIKSTIRKSHSAKNIHELREGMGAPVEENELNTKRRVMAKSVTFVTPKTKQFSSESLKSKLENWLKMKGHSLEEYRHLRCFEIDNSTTVFRPSAAVPSEQNVGNSHASAVHNTPSEESNKENITPPTVIPQVDVTQVENWLKELHVLIAKMKYPSDRCEEWLAAIRKKYPKCSQLPIYWECRAALNESKGDVKSAIEDYERVIIKGGQVESVGNSLAQLFDKMVIEQKKPKKSKIEKGIDPKNIFKSTIIKFALQQKTLRKLGSQMAPEIREQLYVATPVRRSSRIQTPLKSKEVDSLETLTPDVKRNLTFKLNESLLEAD